MQLCNPRLILNAIVLADGVYPLDRTLTFTAVDGGSAEQPVVWRAAKNTKPVLSGGRVINGWQAPEQGNIWTTTIDEVAKGDWSFQQFWVEAKRATCRFHDRLI